MKFLSKISKAIGKDDGEDFDQEEVELEDDGDLEVNDSDEDGGNSKGLFCKLFRRSKGDDDEEIDVDDDRNESPAANDEPPIQRVQVEGVADVRSVGSVGNGMGSAGGEGRGSPNSPNHGPSQGPTPAVDSGSDTNDVGPAGGTESGRNGEDKTSSADPGDELGFNLKDLFEEVVEVDDNLKDLADSQEDVPAEDLAVELREFLAELEN